MTASHSSSARDHEHAVAHDAGVVHDHVEPAEGVDGRADEALGALPVGDVVAVDDGLAAGGHDLVDDLPAGAVEPPVPSSSAPMSLTTTLAPCRANSSGVAAADAPPGAGDDDDPPLADAGHAGMVLASTGEISDGSSGYRRVAHRGPRR